jgi:hypothetical protein
VTIRDAENRVIDAVRFPLPHAGNAMIGFAPQLMNGRSALAERLDGYLRARTAAATSGG